MKTYILHLYTYLFVGLSFLGIISIYAQTEDMYIANLNGSQVVPPINTNASGIATFLFYGDFFMTEGVSYNITAQNISNITAIELRSAPEDVNGRLLTGDFSIATDYKKTNVVSEGELNLNTDFTGDLMGKGESEFDALKRIINDNEVYIEIHTEKYPAGEIRGQFYNPHNTK
jgi:hypothetical protein